MDEYSKLINQECYAPTILGRELTQDEVDDVVEVLDEKYECSWGEEHLIEVLKEYK